MSGYQEVYGISRRRRRGSGSRDFLVKNLELESGYNFLLEVATPSNPQFILLEG
jgi:hypothetical protein